jgi:hypothetical protein
MIVQILELKNWYGKIDVVLSYKSKTLLFPMVVFCRIIVSNIQLLEFGPD